MNVPELAKRNIWAGSNKSKTPRKITNAKIFKGTLDAFREELSKETYTFVHFIGHGQITIDTTKLELTFTDTTSTPQKIQCIQLEVFLKLLIQK